MFTGFNKLMELIYICPQNSDYVYSSSESFLEGEENKEQRRVLDNWLTHFGITLHKAHCSGHAGKSDLKYAVRKINPEILIPIQAAVRNEWLGASWQRCKVHFMRTEYAVVDRIIDHLKLTFVAEKPPP